MFAEFRHLDGPAAGNTCVIRKDFATIGRHPSAEIAFDAERDLDVSGRHAAVFRQGESWVIRDLGSTNGTWINDERIREDRPLVAGDVVRFGPKGPRLAFRPFRGEPPTVPATRPSPAATPRMAAPSETTRVRAEVRRQTGVWRRLALGTTALAALALVAVSGLAFRESRRLDAERSVLLARTDSALARLEATTTTVTALRAALDSAREDTHRLRAEVASGGEDAEALASLTTAVESRLEHHSAVLRAAEFDASAIARDNGDAIALVVSELADGRRLSGTGFSVRVVADTGWIATARHLVSDALGRSPLRLGVIFNGSSQNFRADVAARSDSADLAILTVRIRGGMPVVRTLDGSAMPGDPVAILGFPFGFDFPVGGDWHKLGVSVSSFAGSLTGMTQARLTVKSFGTTGSSGSPVFNAGGAVVGVVFGGDPASAGGIVYATPVRVLQALLADLPKRE